MQASVSNNTTIKIDGGGTSATISGTVMSTTASQYAILTYSVANGDQFTIGSCIVSGVSGTSTSATFYIPPSTTVTRVAGTINASWVLFTNSP